MVYGFMILNPSIRPQEKRPPGFSTDEPHPLQEALKSLSEFNSDAMDKVLFFTDGSGKPCLNKIQTQLTK